MIPYYLSDSNYGGWVNFSAHLLRKLGHANLLKLGESFSNKMRPFGYGIMYQNLTADFAAIKKKNLILAIDKNHRKYLDKFNSATIVIHDPTEVKPEVIPYLKKFKVITIRKSVQDYLRTLDIESEFLYHPFYEFGAVVSQNKEGAIATSRIDFDKHTDIILKANKNLKNPVKIFGFINRIYAFHNLKELQLDKYYNGTYPKEFSALNNLYKDAKFLVDLSAIKNDGGGTQYTFLEAIYHDVALILNKKWILPDGDFIPGENCFAVENEQELQQLLESNPDTKQITSNAKLLLQRHLNEDWNRVL